MAQSICPKCSSSVFEVVEHQPKGSTFPLNFTQCSTCGCVVGVTEQYNVGKLIQLLANKLNINLFEVKE